MGPIGLQLLTWVDIEEVQDGFKVIDWSGTYDTDADTEAAYSLEHLVVQVSYPGPDHRSDGLSRVNLR